jgi:hypothetical protein
MTRSMTGGTGGREARRSVTSARAAELGPISVGLGVAAIEFAACGAILLALVVLGVLSAAAAATWAAVVLGPLSATIAFRGFRVAHAGRRAGRPAAGGSLAELPEAV